MFLNQKIKDNVEDMGINVFYKNHVSSTNDYIKHQYVKDKTPILIMTNNQRSPRGRRGSLWVDYQFHSLSFTLCLKLDGAINDYENLSQIIGLSIVQSCRKFEIKDLKLKWPNDIMSGEKKVCGILVENFLEEEHFFYSAIGIGFNISIPEKFLNIIDGNPGNLNISSHKIEKLIPEILKTIIFNVSKLKEDGFEEFSNSINEYIFVKREKSNEIIN
ncbi:MAG: biotin--[acetyl-CoA-carboxylase] ligase [Pseudomonadota bacterium]|nr:biotin--[acetyl-CoA-carboxylase] ligase [Pseudomonadota bacterium]